MWFGKGRRGGMGRGMGMFGNGGLGLGIGRRGGLGLGLGRFMGRGFSILGSNPNVNDPIIRSRIEAEIQYLEERLRYLKSLLGK